MVAALSSYIFLFTFICLFIKILKISFYNVVLISAMLCYAMLSYFSCVRLCATPEMAAHQAPPSLGFSRQEREVYLRKGKKFQINNLSLYLKKYKPEVDP